MIVRNNRELFTALIFDQDISNSLTYQRHTMEKPTVSSIWSPQFLARHNVTERRFVSAFIKTGPTEGWLRNSFITRRVDGSEVTEYTWSTMPENRLTKKVRSPLKPVEQEYQRCRSHWKDSNGWKNSGWIQELKKSFTTALLETSTSISQVICMGVGSFTSHFDPAYSEVRTEASYHQLCALELMMDILSLHQKTVFNTKKVYMQDPNFDDVDEEFLSSKGFSVIRGLDANNMMTSSTFLYAPYLPWKETFKAFMVDCPALHMGNKLDEIIGRLL